MTDLLTADYAIRQLHARFIDAAYRKDAAAFAACFTEDAEWKIAGQHFRGRAEIHAGFARLLGFVDRTLILISPPQLIIEKSTATGRVYVTELMKKADGESMRTIGLYTDRYAGTGLDWRFTSREWQLCYRGAPDLSAPFVEFPDPGPLSIQP
jgi:ketosteroid isomerase-like protein